jgi:hypothetical protein
LVDIGFYHTKNGTTTCFVCGFTTGPWDLNADPLKVKHDGCFWYDMIVNAKINSFNAEARLSSFENGWVGRDSISAQRVLEFSNYTDGRCWFSL